MSAYVSMQLCQMYLLMFMMSHLVTITMPPLVSTMMPTLRYFI